MMRDPEGIFYTALMAMLVRDTDRVIALLQITLDRGWFCYQAIAREPVLDDLRSDPRPSYARWSQDSERPRRRS